MVGAGVGFIATACGAGRVDGKTDAAFCKVCRGTGAIRRDTFRANRAKPCVTARRACRAAGTISAGPFVPDRIADAGSVRRIAMDHRLALLLVALLFTLGASTPVSAHDPAEPEVEQRPMPRANGFDALDTDRSGYLDKDELAPDPPRQRDFEKYDDDGDGRITKDEWMNGKNDRDGSR
jgi:hypothetical protein